MSPDFIEGNTVSRKRKAKLEIAYSLMLKYSKMKVWYVTHTTVGLKAFLEVEFIFFFIMILQDQLNCILNNRLISMIARFFAKIQSKYIIFQKLGYYKNLLFGIEFK